MADVSMLLCAPNHMEDTFEPPYLGSGSWRVDSPLSNIGAEFFANRSTVLANDTASTRFQVAFDIAKRVGFLGIPLSNAPIGTKLRWRGTDVVKWDNVFLSAPASAGATSITAQALVTPSDVIEAGMPLGGLLLTLTYPEDTGTVNAITVGDLFTLGDSRVVYEVTQQVTLSPTDFTIHFKRTDGVGGGLVASAPVNTSVVCRSGNYTTPLFDTGMVDFFEQVSEPLVAPWGTPECWDGFPSEESLIRTGQRKQRTLLLDQRYAVQYMRVDFELPPDIDEKLWLADVYITDVYRPRYNMEYGAVFGLRSNTVKESNPSGVDVFQEERPRRYCEFSIFGLTMEEALVGGIYDLYTSLDISGNFFFIYQDNFGSELMRRTAFPARFRSIDEGISQDFFDTTRFEVTVEERLG